MITPNENEFTEHDPLSIASSPIGDRSLHEETRINPGSSGDKWEQTKAKATHARERTEFFLRENPIPTIVAALGVGLIIGWALRHSISSDEDEEVEVKSPLGNMSLSFLSLPFLLPFFKSLKERYEDSAETVKDGMGRLKKMDIAPYTKPIRKRWKALTG